LPRPASLIAFFGAVVAAALALAPLASGQPPARAAAQGAVDPLRHLHRDATAFGHVDLARLRGFRHFRRLVRYGVHELDAPTRAISRVRSILERSDAIYVSLVRGPGRTADVATVLLHGTYQPSEVPSAVQSLLPGLLQGLWEPTQIEGHTAYDVGVGALVQLSEHDWLLARRIGDELPVSPREVPPALAGAEYQRLSGLAGFGRNVAEGVLVGAADTESAQLPPDGPGFLYHRTRAAYGHLSVADAAEARFAFEMHSEEGARWRADYFRDLLQRVARNVQAEQGGSGQPMRFEITQRGAEVAIGVTLDPEQVDAYVARFLTGRLLSASASEGSSAAVAEQSTSE
jgi:hypothetical protein